MTHCKKTTVKLLIAVLALLALSMALVACNIGDSVDNYDWLVTFEYNKGNLEGNTETQWLGVFDNSLISIRPGYSDGSNDFEEKNIQGYYIEGWYLPAEIDEDGHPKTDENGFVILGRKWNFSKDRVTQDITLYSNYKRKTNVRFIDRATGLQVEGDTGRIELIPGDIARKPSDSSAPRMANFTFLGKYYVAMEGSEEFQWPVQVGEEDINVYVEFLKGEWRFVSTPNDFVRAMQAGRNIYLQADIDFAEYLQPMLWGLTEYNGEIDGQGHTIKNVRRTLTASRNNTENFASIFGSLGEKAYIHDITFENITLKFNVNSSLPTEIVDVYVGLIAGESKKGSRLENIKVTGELTYTPDNNHPVRAGVIGNNNSDIKNCDFANAQIKEAQ